jgi:acyl-CoA thioesterase I
MTEMSRSARATWLLLLCALPGGALAAPPPIPAQCAAPDSFAVSDEKLEHVAEALRPGGTLGILALGSATMVGSGTDNSSFPYRMAQDLRAAVPGVTVTLEVRGGRGMTAADMLALLREELTKGHYQLVIWQTGTVEAVRNLPPEEFLDTLTEGAGAVEQAGADLVLVDPQFSRFLRAHANVDPYEEVLQQVAGLSGVVLFRRYDLMETWADDDRIDLEHAPRTRRQQTVALLHGCIGAFLARFILSGAGAGPS